jgi:choline dehydrogenase-like flavoprotein
MTHYDYIAIGAGSAGCVVANRLTKDPETTVLLLEAGNPDTKPEIHIPAECINLLGTDVDWGYFSEPEPYLNHRKIFCSRGKVLGGSSSINFMNYVRGNPHDYDHWKELGNLGWSYQDVLPYFKKSEHSSRGESEFHGIDGELSVTDLIAHQEVILSAGAFDSPKLLMLSGIGNAEELRALNIPVVADRPGVGQNLQDHILVPIVYQATQDLHYASTSGIGEAGLFLHSEVNSEVAPDLQFLFNPTQFLPPGYAPAEFGFTGAVTLTHLQNVGSVSLRSRSVGFAQSSDSTDPPQFQMNYLQSETDVQKLVFSIKLMRQLLHTSSLDEFRGAEIAPDADIQSNEALEAYIRDTASTVGHQVGTCKMGTDPMAVVDPELRVHGIQGLRVVDASIMPKIATGNTNAPTIMIGEKAADLIRKKTSARTID